MFAVCINFWSPLFLSNVALLHHSWSVFATRQSINIINVGKCWQVRSNRCRRIMAKWFFMERKGNFIPMVDSVFWLWRIINGNRLSLVAYTLRWSPFQYSVLVTNRIISFCHIVSGDHPDMYHTVLLCFVDIRWVSRSLGEAGAAQGQTM